MDDSRPNTTLFASYKLTDQLILTPFTYPETQHSHEDNGAFLDPPHSLFRRRSAYCVPGLSLWQGEMARFKVAMCTMYQVIEQKQRNAKEMWYTTNGSFTAHLSGTRSTKESFIYLPINHWNHSRRKVLLPLGSTCDALDFYANGSDSLYGELPHFDEVFEDQFVGLFHIGAYRDALCCYGGVSHGLVSR